MPGPYAALGRPADIRTGAAGPRPKGPSPPMSKRARKKKARRKKKANHGGKANQG
ncbi:50S ribosomal protein bL37 [Streptomyces noursei]|uniref:50S ribosomal protein bL37 n=1 Tax=Streptomyces noursei TaxID=1971 RepID=UPI001964D43E|nr:hypothetical protein [Streptomyces noursei]QRX90197.1 hypothetical protein JNO44_04380 [Streptomyces noursei]